MTVKISSIDSIEVGHRESRHFMVAELEFEDEEAVAKDLGVDTCVGAFNEGDVYTALGDWKSAKEYYADEIEDAIEARLAELAKESETIP